MQSLLWTGRLVLNLNPIENFWEIQELKFTIIQEYESLPQNILNKLVNSIPKRVGDVIFSHARHLDN